MQTLCIAIGNPLRGDDGVAYRVLDLLEPADCLRVQQLTPEVAEAIARARSVMIIDADVNPGLPRIEEIVTERLQRPPLSHAMSPAEVVCLARRLFGFEGAAYVCRVPGQNFDPCEELSSEAESNAHHATHLVADLCASLNLV